MAPDSDSFPQAYNRDNFQHPASFSRLPSNVMGSPASGIPPQSHHPTDNYSGVDPASRMAPDSDSFPQAYNHDNFQHPASFSRLPSNITGSPASGIPPQSHHPTDNYSGVDPTDNYSGVDPASRMAPDSDSFPQAYNHDNFQHPASFSRLPPNVMGSRASGIPPQSHHPTDNYSGVDPASRMAPDLDSFPQAYNHDNFQHPASFSRLPSNVMGSPASGIPPQSHHPTDNYSGVDLASRMAPDSDSFPQAYNHDNFQHFASFSRLPSNVMGSRASGIPPQSHHPTDNYSGVDPASRMAPDSDSFPQAYNHDNFQHPASFSRLPSNITGSPASGIPPQSHHPTDNYSGVDPASRMAPNSDSFPQAYNHDNFQHPASFSRLPPNVMGSPASGIPPQSHHPTDNYSGVDPASRMAPDSDSFPHAYNHDNFQHHASFSRLPSNVMGSLASGIPPQFHHPTDNYSGVDPASRMARDSDSFPQAYNRDNFQHPASFSRLPSNVAAPPPSTMAPPSHFPSENIHQPPNGSEHSVYHHQSHPHPPYQPEPHQSIPQNYPSHDIPSFASHPNFQSYLSFTESSLPAAPSHYPYYQGSDVATYTSSPPSNAAVPYASTPKYSSSGKNGSLSEVSSPTSERYEYDSSYQPPPEKIVEAHNAARFAVGALAFDEVSVAVDHLKKALDLLTNQSSAH
ncbi:early nodule-specific protein 2-like [Salvia miltiorrhiza]|uniref:early nodule-specific protein 2-like n=1 Tax=Salvia miltiorrhiza TaxID=226208 RepID=UPI0025AC1B7F|nr:early nodule-specific protein 2-like [Salvia miltiorrhiza]